MAPLTSDIFFYGLFMDAAVLEARGVHSTQRRLAVVRGWALRIGQRATLVPAQDEAVHGVLMTLPLVDVDRLYAEASVRMYRPVAYVLPEPPAPEERNPEYAAKLRALAERLGLPGEYTRTIV